jgi:hypothetical protein
MVARSHHTGCLPTTSAGPFDVYQTYPTLSLSLPREFPLQSSSRMGSHLWPTLSITEMLVYVELDSDEYRPTTRTKRDPQNPWYAFSGISGLYVELGSDEYIPTTRTKRGPQNPWYAFSSGILGLLLGCLDFPHIQSVQTGSGAYPASYSVFTGVKAGA